MANTRAEVIYKTGEKRYFEGGMNYNGFLAWPVKVGVGKPYKTVGHADLDDAWVEEFYHEYKTRYRFFFNSDVIAHEDVLRTQ